MAGLPNGDFKVQFFDCGTGAYLTQWNLNKADFDSADTVEVIKKGKTTVDAALTLGGSINGTVTSLNTTDPLPNICVFVYDSSFSFIGFGFTDSSGGYTVIGLPNGDAKVEFQDCGTGDGYLGEWYDDQPDFDSARTVSVAKKVKTPGIDAALTLGGSINGTVTDDTTGDLLEFICVTF